MKQLLIACFGLVISAAAAAQVMECVDAKGNKEYAQSCRPGTVKETEIQKSRNAASAASKAPTAPVAGAAPAGAAVAAPAASPEKTAAERDAEFRKRIMERQEAEAKAAKEQAAAKDAAANCTTAQGQLKSLKDGQRITKVNPKTGERYFLEDDARPAEIANAQKTADSWCAKK